MPTEGVYEIHGVSFKVAYPNDLRDAWDHPWGVYRGGTFEVPENDPVIANPTLWHDVLFHGKMPATWCLRTPNETPESVAAHLSGMRDNDMLAGIYIALGRLGEWRGVVTYQVWVLYGKK